MDHGFRFGTLLNGNRPGNPNAAARCGARTRKRLPCRAPAMRNGRCRIHGGSSTGPRTAEGLARSRRARWKHGRHSAEARAESAGFRALVRAIEDLIARERAAEQRPAGTTHAIAGDAFTIGRRTAEVGGATDGEQRPDATRSSALE